MCSWYLLTPSILCAVIVSGSSSSSYITQLFAFVIVHVNHHDGKYFNKLLLLPLPLSLPSSFQLHTGSGDPIVIWFACFSTMHNDLWLYSLRAYTFHPEHLTMMNVYSIASLLRFFSPFFKNYVKFIPWNFFHFFCDAEECRKLAIKLRKRFGVGVLKNLQVSTEYHRQRKRS